MAVAVQSTPSDESQPELRVAGNANDPLGDQHIEGVDRRGNIPRLGSQEHDHESRKGVVTHSHDDRHENQEKR